VAVPWRGVSVAEDGLYFVRATEKGTLLGRLDPDDGTIDSLAVLEGQVSGPLSVSPDGRSVLYGRTDRADADLIMVEEFR
jgi:hypothetical protein